MATSGSKIGLFTKACLETLWNETRVARARALIGRRFEREPINSHPPHFTGASFESGSEVSGNGSLFSDQP